MKFYDVRVRPRTINKKIDKTKHILPKSLSTLLIFLLVFSFSTYDINTSNAASSTVSFTAAVNYTAGDRPAFDLESGPVSSDLNNDGNIDLITTNAGSATISVFIGAGNGTFAPAVSYASSGTESIHAVVGDFNEDGFNDIAVSNDGMPPESSVSIFINDGDGTFAAAVDYPFTVQAYSVPRLADFNKDGNIDIAVTDDENNPNGFLMVLIGNGDGTFDTAVNYDTGGDYPYSFQVADFNEDTYPDVAITHCDGAGSAISVLLNDGDGTFGSPTLNTVGNCPYLGLAVVDLNNDNNIDIATGNYSSDTLSVLIGNGDGTFDTAVNYASGDQPSGIAYAYFNNDTYYDLVLQNYGSSNVSVFINNGDGTFANKIDYGVGGNSYGVPSVMDLNLDSQPDIAMAVGSIDSLVVLLGNSNGTFDAAATYSVGDNPFGVIDTSDFNEDGLRDMAVANRTGDSMSILLNSTTLPTIGFDIETDDQLESVTSPEIQVALSVATDTNVTVNYAVTGGTATGSGTDYTLASGTLTIPEGDTTGLIPITIVDDSLTESMETIQITLTSPVSAILDTDNDVGIYYIVDNDAPSSGSSGTTREAIERNLAQQITQPVVETPIPPSNPTPVLPPENTSSLITKTLMEGMNDTEVKTLQQYLNNHGFSVSIQGAGSPGNETIYFRKKTLNAVLKFQQANPPLVVDGIVGSKTRGVINKN